MCTKEVPHEEVAYMVNYLANCNLKEEWQFGKESCPRAAPPPLVSHFFFSFSLTLLTSWPPSLSCLI